jgi:hypothetical protein
MSLSMGISTSPNSLPRTPTIVLVFSSRGTNTAWRGGQHQARTGTIILRELPPKQIPFRSHGLIRIAERKHHAKPRSRAVNFLIHNETTHEVDRPIDWFDGVRCVRFNTLGHDQAAVRGPLLSRRLAVLVGSLPDKATLSRQSKQRREPRARRLQRKLPSANLRLWWEYSLFLRS